MDAIRTSEYYTYLSRAVKAPRSTTETRIALVSQQLGLSDEDLEPFYYVNRKGAKKRFFDHEAFAQKYGVDVHWLRNGSLREHPRHLNPPVRRTNSNVKKQRRSRYGTPEERAAKLAAVKARVSAGSSMAAPVVEISSPCGENQRAAPSARTTWIDIFQHLRIYVVREFARGKDIDQIFDQIIAEAPAEFR